MKLILWAFIVCYCGLQFVNCHDNRIPPGVPPQQYQQVESILGYEQW